eukprot:scaffold181132_cov19-Tisochrysis_lutea.AAC.2
MQACTARSKPRGSLMTGAAPLYNPAQGVVSNRYRHGLQSCCRLTCPQRSARTTFPELQNFRLGKVRGCSVSSNLRLQLESLSSSMAISSLPLKEVGSLSLEPGVPGQEVVVSLFEVACTPESVQLFIEREHEFKFVSVDVQTLEGQPTGRRAVGA